MIKRTIYYEAIKTLLNKWVIDEEENVRFLTQCKGIINHYLYKEGDNNMMTDKQWKQLNHFEKWEWVKDPDKVSRLLAFSTDGIRDRLGRACYIHVCWDNSGHSDNSYHYTGQAVDLHFSPPEDPNVVNSHLEEFAVIMSFKEIGGVGFYPEWGPRPGWHIDTRNRDVKLLWTRVGGKYYYGIDTILKYLGERKEC